MFLFASHDLGGQRLITKYRSVGALNSMDERPPSKTTGFWLAVMVRETLLVKKENILIWIEEARGYIASVMEVAREMKVKSELRAALSGGSCLPVGVSGIPLRLCSVFTHSTVLSYKGLDVTSRNTKNLQIQNEYCLCRFMNALSSGNLIPLMTIDLGDKPGRVDRSTEG